MKKRIQIGISLAFPSFWAGAGHTMPTTVLVALRGVRTGLAENTTYSEQDRREDAYIATAPFP